MLNDEQLEYLEKKQAEYGKWHQDVSLTVQYMAEHGHPSAADFRRYRKLFDSLPFASGPGTRFYSFKEENNYSELLPPYLSVSQSPQPFNGYNFDLSSSNFMEYLTAAARSQWPEETSPSFNLGRWRIATTDIQMADALIFIYAHNEHHVQNSTIYIQFDDLTQEAFEEVQAVIDMHHSGYLLAPSRPVAPVPAFLPSVFDCITAPDCWL